MAELSEVLEVESLGSKIGSSGFDSSDDNEEWKNMFHLEDNVADSKKLSKSPSPPAKKVELAEETLACSPRRSSPLTVQSPNLDKKSTTPEVFPDHNLAFMHDVSPSRKFWIETKFL